MTRDAYKFLSGSAAAMAYAHAAYAVAASKGVMNEPVLFGRRFGVKFAWSEVAVYSAISVALAYRGWLAKSTPQLSRPRLETTGPIAVNVSNAHLTAS